MSDSIRPIPTAKEHDTKAFWAATRDKEFKYQQCNNCNKVIFYPRAHCTGCTTGKLEWKTSAGQGTVYSFSVVRQSYHPFFRNMVPYVVAWIDMDEGPRILSNVIGLKDPAVDVSIGQKVQVEWEEHETLSIPLFKPV
jgi:uncharacterized OB-fold protein